ncbi:MAG: TonB-dependent receptor [Bacteroidales bacterium]|nr:TonB-dependent receptor [Bacteroidales bacterium]
MSNICQFIFLGLFLTINVHAQKKYTVSGSITDGSNGEDLIGATVSIPGTSTGAVTNAYGFYSISLPEGKYTLRYSFVGYTYKDIPLQLSGDLKMNISLDINETELEEVIISAEAKNINVSKPEMSVERLSSKTIKSIPALMGEVDVIKAVQLLPGVQSTAEGSSGFSVRGGGHDQNLILLDEATVYNASHLMGFFSVFNNDAVSDVKLYKGDIPATFGGRLSSVMDIRSRNGNNQRFSGTGGIGLISSRLTLEGPIGNDQLTFLLSGRRTYADLFLKMSTDKDLRKTKLYFYDMNAKLNYRINDNNRIFLAGYFGKDVLSAAGLAGIEFGNKTLTFRWNHTFSPKLFSNFSLIGSFYDYYMDTNFGSTIDEYWKSQMQDYGFKADLSYHLNPKHHLKFGYNFVFHRFSLGEGGGKSDNSILQKVLFPKEFAAEHAIYIASESSIGDHLTLKYGLRWGLFQNISNGEEIKYLDDYQVTEIKTIEKRKIYHHQNQLEPRVGMLYQFNEKYSLKASYARTVQYIQLASNSTAGSPLDVWFQASPNIKPQLCDQYALGYFRNFSDNAWEASVELYYKNMKNVVDFKDHAELMANEDLEQEVRFGKGYAYGTEFMLRKNSGKLSGWISYTWSHSKRKIDEINNGEWYRSPYDKPHNISLVATYELSHKWTISGNWVYATGNPVTFPTGRYEMENQYVPIYSGRNEYRYPDYHRLDLSVTWNLSKPGSRLKNELNFSIYNAYARKNPWTIYFKQEKEKPDVTYAEMLYLFSIVPSVTWNFTF